MCTLCSQAGSKSGSSPFQVQHTEAKAALAHLLLQRHCNHSARAASAGAALASPLVPCPALAGRVTISATNRSSAK